MINKIITLILLGVIGLTADGLNKIKQDICVFKVNENISRFDIRNKGCVYSFIAKRTNGDGEVSIVADIVKCTDKSPDTFADIFLLDERGSRKTFVAYLNNKNCFGISKDREFLLIVKEK